MNLTPIYNRKTLLLISIGIIPAVFLFLVYRIIDFNGLYGQDSFDYLRYSRAIHDFFLHGTVPGSFHWPVLYPFAGAIVSFVVPDVLSLQVVSLLSYGFTIVFLLKILDLISIERSQDSTLFILLFFALSPFILRYSSSAMSDPLALLFISGFCYYYLLYIKEQKNKHF